jgi:alginate O-acetyltransferase complex protein AlgI
MSLTRWLSYLFIRWAERALLAQVYFNVLVTMLISGLWHGAGLNFLVWDCGMARRW